MQKGTEKKKRESREGETEKQELGDDSEETAKKRHSKRREQREKI